jgi:hypothetical protein
MVIPGQIATYPAIIAYVVVKRFNVLRKSASTDA